MFIMYEICFLSSVNLIFSDISPLLYFHRLLCVMFMLLHWWQSICTGKVSLQRFLYFQQRVHAQLFGSYSFFLILPYPKKSAVTLVYTDCWIKIKMHVWPHITMLFSFTPNFSIINGQHKNNKLWLMWFPLFSPCK